MATTPEPIKGVPRIEGNPAPSLRADHNSLADWVRDHIGENVASKAALPTTYNYPSRRVFVRDENTFYAWLNAVDGWVRDGGGHRIAPMGVTAPGLTPTRTPLLQTGQIAARTSASGRVDYTLPVAAPNGIAFVTLQPHQNTGHEAASPPVVIEGSITRTGFGVFFGNRPNTQIYLPYRADIY